MNEAKVTLVQITCFCGAGIHLTLDKGSVFAGKCPLCSKEYSGPAGPFTLADSPKILKLKQSKEGGE